jgi:thiol-disulfide isomerase/thioredoxin
MRTCTNIWFIQFQDYLQKATTYLTAQRVTFAGLIGFITFLLTISFRLYTILLLGFICSCGGQPAVSKKIIPQNGQWEMLFAVDDIRIPIELFINDSSWNISNASEKIVLNSIEWTENKFHVKMPLFNSSLDGTLENDSMITGLWTDHSRIPLYTIPFTIKKVTERQHNSRDTTDRRTYDVTFSPEIADATSKAVGIFYFNGNKATGTFLTETGDYRYLEGTHSNNKLELGCFDGAHLFHFSADIQGDSLQNGRFQSGKHWKENWEGHLDPKAHLRDPDSLTTLKDPTKAFQFVARSAEGDSVLFDKEDFENKVTIVQIWGSWCPNCTDESIFLKKLHRQYGDRGLQIIPVSFERSTNFEEAKKIVTNQFNELDLTYKPYFGGLAEKNEASRVFSDLSKILSYPTTIFIDKKGVVRKIHTGFYGPGTGDHYIRHTEALEMFVQQLLAE